MISIPTTYNKGFTIGDRLSKSTSSLVIIDSSVENIQQLKAGLKPGAEVVVLHPQLNGIEQITALVSRRKNLQKLHLVSHGSTGSLKLGSSGLNLDNINDYSTQLQTWFGDRGDRVSLLVYGCQVASGVRGKSFVQKLHQLTGANITAATQTVGSSSRGAAWQLDYTVGKVESELAFSEEVIQTYSGIFMEEEPVEEALEDTETLTNFEGAELQFQQFFPNMETSTSDPIIAEVSNDEVEFTSDEIFGSDRPDDTFIPDLNIDITGGPGAEGSIIYEVGENQTPVTGLSGDFNGGIFTDVSEELPPIINATLDQSVTTFDLEADDVTFDENSVEINFESLDTEPGLIAKIDVEFADDATTSPSDEEETPDEGTPVVEPVDDGDTAVEETSGEDVVEEPVVEEPAIEDESIDEPIAEEDLVDEATADEDPVEDESIAEAEEELIDEDETVTEEDLLDEEPVDEFMADEPVGEESVEEPQGEFNDLIDLSAISDQEVTFTTAFDVSREAGLENTVDFYEVNADGSVIDDSGETITVGEEGYTEAALYNRVGLELATENGTVSEFSTELQGGKLYAPLIAVDSSIEALSDDNPDNDPAIYFTYSDANVDGFDHIRSPRINRFEFEDLPNGGDEDFNDLVVDVSFQEESLIDPLVDEPVVEEPAVEPVVDEVVDEPVVEEPQVEPVVEPVVDEVVDEPVIEEVVDEPVVDEPVTEEASEDSSTLTNFEGAEIQVQIFAPDLESPTSDPITAVVNDGIEFDDDLPPSDNPGDNLFPANVDIDLTGGIAGEGSISFTVDEDQTPDSFIPGDFNGYVFTDISGDLPAIENVTLDESVNTLGLEPSDITFSENTFEVNVESLRAEPGLTALLDVDFADV